MDAIDYYNKYASRIFEDTVDQDMGELWKKFLANLEEGDTILDLGCGSGRDSAAFYELGYDVTPLDAAEEMAKLAEIHTGLDVLRIAYEDMEFEDVFDGIWGSGALVHVPAREMEDILEKVTDALCQGGTLYLSFRKGDFEGFEGGLYYNDYTPEGIERMLEDTRRLNIREIWESGDPGGDDVQWVHVLARKIA